MMSNQPKINAEMIADCVQHFRASKPHVHCITNGVAQNFTANVLLATGATPSMTVSVAEVASFVEMADALLINLGTLDPERNRSVHIAAKTANILEKPWAVDPVFVQASPSRLELARFLLDLKPSLVRCNLAEGRALFDDELELKNLSKLSSNMSVALAITGREDLVQVSHRNQKILNGHPLMDRVTTMGCALTAIIVGFMSVEEDPVLAITSSLVLFGLSGEVAGKKSQGPGSFALSFLDALHNLDSDQIVQGAKFK